MLKFTIRATCALPIWLLYQAVMLPLILAGFPIVALLALYLQLRFKYTSHTRTNALHFPALFWLWDNTEDGVDGDPWSTSSDEPKNPAWFEESAAWSLWRRVFVWSTWRNSVGNARFTRLFGMTVKPRAVRYVIPGVENRDRSQPLGVWWADYRKLGPYFAHQGWRCELRFPWTTFQCNVFNCTRCATNRRFFWIGWRIAQQDIVTKNVGFALQPWGKL